jgi:AraC-like DNA-binding protein
VATYTERPIHPGLADSAVCAWVNPPALRRHAVLPDACMDIVWDGARLLVAGPDTGPVEVEPGVGFVGIRFKPGMAIGFLGVSAGELRDRRVPLAEFWGREAERLAERLADAPEAALRLIEQALFARCPGATSDPLLEQVVRALVRSGGGAVEIRALARRLGVNCRTLRRRCVRGFGYGPKTLDRILRFRRALRLGRAGHPIAAAAFAAGYADQAHLARECRRLAGVSPGALFADPTVIVSTGE